MVSIDDYGKFAVGIEISDDLKSILYTFANNCCSIITIRQYFAKATALTDRTGVSAMIGMRCAVMRLSRVAAGVAAGVLFVGLLAGPADAASLADELRGLLTDHPRLASSSALLRSAKHGEEVATAPFYPKLTITGDAGYEHTDSPGTRAAAAGPHLGTDRYSNSVFMTWNLFDGFASTTGKAAAVLGTGIAEESKRRTTHALVLEGATAYLNVLRQSDLLRALASKLSSSTSFAVNRGTGW